MKIRLQFSNGLRVDLPCDPAELQTVAAGPGRGHRHAEPPAITGYVFIGTCGYDEAEFETANPRRKYCCESHKRLFSYYGLGKNTGKHAT